MASDRSTNSGNILFCSGGNLEQMTFLADRSVVIVDVEAANATTLDSSREPSPYSRGVLFPNHLSAVAVDDELTVFDPGSDRDQEDNGSDVIASVTTASSPMSSSSPPSSASRLRSTSPSATQALSAGFPSGGIPLSDTMHSLAFSDSNVSISESDSPLATIHTSPKTGTSDIHNAEATAGAPHAANEFIFSKLLGLFRHSKAVVSNQLGTTGAPPVSWPNGYNGWSSPPASSMSLSPSSSLSGADSTALMESDPEDAHILLDTNLSAKVPVEQFERLPPNVGDSELTNGRQRRLRLGMAYRRQGFRAGTRSIHNEQQRAYADAPTSCHGNDLNEVNSQVSPLKTDGKFSGGPLLSFERWPGTYSALPTSGSPKEPRQKTRAAGSRLSAYLPTLLGKPTDGSPQGGADAQEKLPPDRGPTPKSRKEARQQPAPVEAMLQPLRRRRHGLQRSLSAKTPPQSPASGSPDQHVLSEVESEATPDLTLTGPARYGCDLGAIGVTVASCSTQATVVGLTAADCDDYLDRGPASGPTSINSASGTNTVTPNGTPSDHSLLTLKSPSLTTHRSPKDTLPQVSLHRNTAWSNTPGTRDRHVEATSDPDDGRANCPPRLPETPLRPRAGSCHGVLGYAATAAVVADEGGADGSHEDHYDTTGPEPWGSRMRRLFSWSRGTSDQSSPPAKLLRSKWNSSNASGSNPGYRNGDSHHHHHHHQVLGQVGGSSPLGKLHRAYTQLEEGSLCAVATAPENFGSNNVSKGCAGLPRTTRNRVRKGAMSPLSCAGQGSGIAEKESRQGPFPHPRRSQTLCASILRHDSALLVTSRPHDYQDRTDGSDSEISIDGHSSHGSATTSRGSLGSEKLASQAEGRRRKTTCVDGTSRKSKRAWTLRKLARRSCSGSNSNNGGNSTPNCVPHQLASPSRSNSVLIFRTNFLQRCQTPSPVLSEMGNTSPLTGNAPRTRQSPVTPTAPLSPLAPPQQSLDSAGRSTDDQVTLFLPLTLFPPPASTVSTENDGLRSPTPCSLTGCHAQRADRTDAGDGATSAGIKPLGVTRCGEEAFVATESWTRKRTPRAKPCLRGGNCELSAHARRSSLDSVCFDPTLVIPRSPHQLQNHLRLTAPCRPTVFTRMARRATTSTPASLRSFTDWEANTVCVSCNSSQPASPGSVDNRPSFVKPLPAATPDSRQPQSSALLRAPLELSPGKLLDNSRSRAVKLKHHHKGPGGEAGNESHSQPQISSTCLLDGGMASIQDGSRHFTSNNPPKYCRSSTGIDSSPSRRILKSFWSPTRKHSSASCRSPKPEIMKDSKLSHHPDSPQYNSAVPPNTLPCSKVLPEVHGTSFSTFQQIASLQGHNRLISKFVHGINVQVIVKQRVEAVLADAKLALETLVGRFSKFKSFLVLEISGSTRTVRRALRIDPRRPASTAQSSLQFLERVTEADPKCAEVIAQLLLNSSSPNMVTSSSSSASRYWSVSRSKYSGKTRQSPIFITVPVKSTSEGSLVFLLRSIEERDELEAIVALLQAYDSTFSSRFEPEVEAE